jgi:hypothetical protein
MVGWWTKRLIWLCLGALTGVIGILPESAGVLASVLVLIYGTAWAVMLGRWAAGEFAEFLKSLRKKPDPDKLVLSTEVFPGGSLEFEASRAGKAKPQRPKSGWLLSYFRAAGYQFKTQLKMEDENADPRKAALVWDSVMFLGAVLGSAALMSFFV